MPIDGLGQVVLPLDADVGVPLADDPHVLLEHPPVTSGDADLELEQRPGGVRHTQLLEIGRAHV